MKNNTDVFTSGSNFLQDPFSSRKVEKSFMETELEYWVTEDGDNIVTEDGDKIIWRRA